MTDIMLRVDALLRLCTADTKEARAEAMRDCQRLVNTPAAPPATNDRRKLDTMIHEILLEVGIPDHLKGQRYLMTALAMVVKDQAATDVMTTHLYPVVAEVHNTSASRCERAIRHAVETAWDRGDLDVLQRYFGNSVSPHKGKPTNREFISRLANAIREQA